MPTIEITRAHAFGVEPAKAKAEEFAKGTDKLGISWKWSGDAIVFDAPSGAAEGTTGRVTVDAASIHVVIDLPAQLEATKSGIEALANKKLDALFP